MERKWKSELIRFSAEFGPKSLFDRIKYKMRDVHVLGINGEHFKERLKYRRIPQEIMDHIVSFDINEWRLVSAEVRKDKGKFYNSTWEYSYLGKRYWITVGLNNTVMTIVEKTSSGLVNTLKEGELYDYVDMVNRQLMENDLNRTI